MTTPRYTPPPATGWWVKRSRKLYPGPALLLLSGGVPQLQASVRPGPASLTFTGSAPTVTAVPTVGDNFNRANSTTSAGPNWTNRGTGSVMGVSGNQAYGVGTGGQVNTATFNTPASTDNHKARAKFYLASTANDLYVLMGCNTTAGSVQFITAEVFATGSTWNLYIITATAFPYGGQTVRATSAALTVVDGDEFSIERSGTLFTARQNGVARCTWNDTAPFMLKDSNHRTCGMGSYTATGTTTARIDDFLITDI